MRIDELTIQNFKCFENETFRFNPHFNVVIGKNASGKSSLLDAASMVASAYISGINDVSFPKLVGANEIRYKLIEGQPKPQFPARIYADVTLHSGKVNFQTQVIHAVNTERNNVNLTGSHNIREILEIAKNDLILSRTTSSVVKFPLISFYGTGRLWGWGNEQNKKLDYFKQGEGVFSAYAGWENSRKINKGFLSFLSFLSWYKTYEDEVKKFSQPLDILFIQIFREAITSMVPQWTDIEFSFKEDDMMGVFVDENGSVNKLPFSSLSDGYRNMIGMVADMVYRCIQLNPGLKENVLTETEGIVLIDELDLHLHPEWQRRIVGDLKRIFPKVQFIVTTHSPFIIQSLKQDELIVLDKNFKEDKDPFRKSVEEIAEDEMQVSNVARSQPFQEMVDIAKRYFTLVKQENGQESLRREIDEAKLKLDELRIRFADDPAYVAMLDTQLEKTSSYAAGGKK